MPKVRPVVCVETGRVFGSAAIAANLLGVHPSGLRACLYGETQTCAGYHWEYAEGQSAQKPENLRRPPTMTIEDVQKEAARRTRETGRYTDYADIQKEVKR